MNKQTKCKNLLPPKKVDRIEKLLKAYENDADKTHPDKEQTINNTNKNIPLSGDGFWIRMKNKIIETTNLSIDQILNEKNSINSDEYKFLRTELINHNAIMNHLKEIIEVFDLVKETAIKLVQDDTYNEKMKDLSIIFNKLKEDNKLLKVKIYIAYQSI